MNTDSPQTGRCCALCRHFEPGLGYRWSEVGADPDEPVLGDCEWQPPHGLPVAWEWCRRDVRGVRDAEGSDCPVFEPR